MASRSTTLIAVAVVYHEGRYLIGRRPPGVPLAGYWEFPGGKVQPGEAPAAAAARECLEEAGLAVTVGAEYPPIVHDYEHGRLEMRFFDCARQAAAGDPRPPFCWVPAEELGRYEFPPANRAILDRLLGE